MIWEVKVGAEHKDYTDISPNTINPLKPRIGPSIYYSVRGRFRLSNPRSRYGFQTDGYLGWGVVGGQPFKEDIRTYLSLWEFSSSGQTLDLWLRSKIFITDPLNFYSWGWYLEEPVARGSVGSHMIYRASDFLNKPLRGVDCCFNQTDKLREDYFPAPSMAFFEDSNSFIYIDPLDPDLPRISCPLPIMLD